MCHCARAKAHFPVSMACSWEAQGSKVTFFIFYWDCTQTFSLLMGDELAMKSDGSLNLSISLDKHRPIYSYLSICFSKDSKM